MQQNLANIISSEVLSAFSLLLYSRKKKENILISYQIGKLTHALRTLTFVYFEPTCLQLNALLYVCLNQIR